MTDRQISHAAAVYKTTALHPRERGGRKYRVDINRAVVSISFTDYVLMGGILRTSYDWTRIRALFPKGV